MCLFVLVFLFFFFDPQGVSGHSFVARGGLLASGIIAVGKVGAVLSAAYMHRHWTPPPPDADLAALSPDQRHEQQTAPFRSLALLLLPRFQVDSLVIFSWLFLCVFLGSVFPILFPVALYLRSEGYDALSLSLAFVSSFFFFLFSTIPKIVQFVGWQKSKKG